MRFDQVSSTLRPISAAEAAAAQTRRAAHLSRRRFLQAGAGAAAVGAALGGGLLKARPARATAPGAGLVVPIPYGLDFFGDGTIFHVEAPPFVGDDPGTVYNFRGTSGISFTDGTVTRTNRETGQVVELPFMTNDMRFMQGEFVGRDGHVREATFGFVWIDVYDPGSGAQLHDFNPGIDSSGFFWTNVYPDTAVQADIEAGTATFELTNAKVKDYWDFVNAVNGGGPDPVQGTVSFRVTWDTGGAAASENDVPSKRLRTLLAPAQARMAWAARTPLYEFVSEPIATSSSPFGALLGSHRNGSFY